jgi:hypothetical protein
MAGRRHGMPVKKIENNFDSSCFFHDLPLQKCGASLPLQRLKSPDKAILAFHAVISLGTPTGCEKDCWRQGLHYIPYIRETFINTHPKNEKFICSSRLLLAQKCKQ